MDRNILIIAALCILASAILVLYNYYRTKKTMDILEQMITKAMTGEFTEETFDESRLSALETKLAHYLSASTVSARNIAIEKDKIKTLIADISHQTKTPISNLLLYTELLSEEDLPTTAHAIVEDLHNQTEKLRFLIDSLVKLSRLENGILTLSPRKEQVYPMLRKVYEQFLPKAKEKGLDLVLEETFDCAIFDPKWTAEAICNIVDNAVKYTEQGTIRISTVGYEMFIRIDIADTGIGIAEEEQPKVFSRFYRGEAVRDSEGVGIGLYLAREIIAEEGGYMKVSSTLGMGSTFLVFLRR